MVDHCLCLCLFFRLATVSAHCIWPLYRLSTFHLWLLITPLVSYNKNLACAWPRPWPISFCRYCCIWKFWLVYGCLSSLSHFYARKARMKSIIIWPVELLVLHRCLETRNTWSEFRARIYTIGVRLVFRSQQR